MPAEVPASKPRALRAARVFRHPAATLYISEPSKLTAAHVADLQKGVTREHSAGLRELGVVQE